MPFTAGPPSRSPASSCALASAGLRWNQLKIHLPFESVDFGNLDLDSIAEFKDAPGATTNQVTALRVELIKIIAQARQRN